ncbi:hypothetical protein GGI20_002331 [Coemansia sp. BCRC 34301]|nr:hypothetical protein GGI20_002331 [Coemansia sp. BCRC 34301]
MDGAGLTRLHFHQFSDWTPELTDRSLARLVDSSDYRGELRYVIWDLLDGCTTAAIAKVVESLQQIDVASGSKQQSQRLAMINFITSALKGAQLGVLATEARNAALDLHVKRLFAYLSSRVDGSNGELGMSDNDRAYVAQVNWAVSQPAYAGIASELPQIGRNGSSEQLQALDCPVCGKDMELMSRQTACCANRHIFDVCSVTLEMLRSPGSDQCNTCKAKRVCSGGRQEGLAGLAKAQFPRCPFCSDRFFSTAA